MIMKSEMLGSIFACVMLAAAVSSCEKMVLSDEKEPDGANPNVVLRVSQFEQTPFAAPTRTVIADMCSRLNFLVYDEDGERIEQEVQDVSDEEFGQVALTIPKGRYYLVVLAHSSNGNPTSTNPRRIAFTNTTGFTDTFFYADSLIVEDRDIERSLALKRIAALVRFVPADTLPKRSDHIRFYYEGGSGTFDATADGWGVVKSKQSQLYTLTHDERVFGIYTIPRADSQYLKVTATTHEESGAELTRREIDSIPIVRNCITTCYGYLFSPVYKMKLNITIETDWGEDILHHF